MSFKFVCQPSNGRTAGLALGRHSFDPKFVTWCDLCADLALGT
ncbi:MAG: hypothetical protein OXN89_07510 [Bryobacterales bacterium]|nr:hypothetical protein [Bryobacterales bacterium]